MRQRMLGAPFQNALGAVLVLGTGLYGAACTEPQKGSETEPVLEAADCPDDLSGRDITCATVEVPEDWSRPDGKTIAVYVVRVVASGERSGEPLFVLRGGPGIPAASRAGSDIERWRALSRHRDVVFVDARGTGRSAALDCRPQGAGTPRFFSGSLTIDDVIRCRDLLSAEHDLSQFNSAATADDLNAVRRALGYDTVSLFGASYGSYLAQIYAQRYPETTAHLVLQAPVPMARDAWAMAAESHYMQARQTEHALLEIISDCGQDAACGAAYADLGEKLDQALSRLAAEPVDVELPAGEATAAQTMRLTKQHVLNLIHALLYDTADATQVPVLVELLNGGRYKPIASTYQRVRSSVVGSVHWGLYLSVFCNEVYTRLDAERALASHEGRFTTVDETAWGLEACRSWPQAESLAAGSPHEALDVPTLILMGALDPVIPPENAELIRRLFPVGPTVVFANTAHSPAPESWRGCSVPLMAAFLSDGVDGEWDARCAGKIQRPDYYLPS